MDDLVHDKMANKAVKKTLTIPKWLNAAAEKQQVNFSQLLQYAIKERLGISATQPMSSSPANDEISATFEGQSI